MRVAINAQPLLGPLTGIGQYTHQLSLALQSLAEPPELRFFYGLNLSPAIAGQTEPVAAGAYPLIRRIPGARMARRCLGQAAFAFHTRKSDLDLYHEPNFFPFRTRLPTVITVHDLSPLRFPQTHLPDRVRYFQRHLPSALRRARAILVDSEFILEELSRTFPEAAGKVVAVPLGVTERFRPRTELENLPVLSRLGLAHGRYLLAVGTLEPRKNLLTAVHAFSRLPEALRRRFPLILAGGRGWLYADLEKAIRPLLQAGQARLLGYVADCDLPCLYAGAAMLLYPSLYEGFGLPPLEAMASGIPVLASNRASIPEVVGTAGCLLEPGDVESWTEMMQSLLEQPDVSISLGQAGVNRARLFSWGECACKTLEVYRRVLADEALFL